MGRSPLQRPPRPRLPRDGLCHPLVLPPTACRQGRPHRRPAAVLQSLHRLQGLQGKMDQLARAHHRELSALHRARLRRRRHRRIRPDHPVPHRQP